MNTRRLGISSSFFLFSRVCLSLSNEQPTFPVHRVTGAVFVVCLDLFVGVKFQRRPRGSPPVTMEVAFPILVGRQRLSLQLISPHFCILSYYLQTQRCPPVVIGVFRLPVLLLLLLTGIVQEYHYG